ncbi:MAG: HalOD1 output domain-containing protein [Haloferacaceae archaeon]
MTSDSSNSPTADSPGTTGAVSQIEPEATGEFDPDQNADLTSEIVFAIAEARGGDPAEVRSPPLYESVDTEALEQLFFGEFSRENGLDETLSLEFPYAEFLVRVESDGSIEVYRR